MKFKIIIALLFFFASSIQVISAQKFGHINSALIIRDHPKVAAANLELENFQKLLADSFEIKVKAFEAKYKTFLEQSNTGTLSAVAIQNSQAELKTLQEALATEEQQLQFRMVQRREALLKPILSDIDGFIQAIGKEGNYTMIFDTSVGGALLFAEQGEDLTEMIRSKCMAK